MVRIFAGLWTGRPLLIDAINRAAIVGMPFMFRWLSCAVLFALAFISAARADLNGELYNTDDWFRTDPRAIEIADNILLYQSPEYGGWPKNVDTTVPPRKPLSEKQSRPTFDNGATVNELRFLGRLYNARRTGHPAQVQPYRDAFDRGLQYILKAQYRNGGWPQSYPVDDTYHRYITFNDGAMPRIMEFLQEVTQNDTYQFLGPQKLSQVQEAVDRGIDCILKSQIRVRGKLTAWCAQHDEKTLRPAKGRAMEFPSLAGLESTYVVLVLMKVPEPTPAIVESIESAIAWFEATRLDGYVIKNRKGEKTPGKFRTISRDSSAEPIWARMYDIESNRPLFASRDEDEPRLGIDKVGYGAPGYMWYGTWPKFVLETHYPAWKTRVGRP